MESLLFYHLAAMVIITTGLAISRQNMVHAVIYLVISFFGSAMLFYLMGAPLLAALEVIVYAGAIMILFIFIIMMLKMEGLGEARSGLKSWLPAIVLGSVYVIIGGVLLFWSDPESQKAMTLAVAEPQTFAVYLFQNHWLAIEIVSLLLLIALVGVVCIDAGFKKYRQNSPEESHSDTL